jgi:hypothetical protein
VYNPVNAQVTPSRFLTTGVYGIHALLLVASLSIPAVFYYYLVPIFAAQAWHVYQLRRQDFLYMQHRHWRFQNEHWYVTLKGQQEQLVQIELRHLWPFVAIFRYQIEDNWHWEIIVKDAVQAEPFRQLRAMLRITHQAI